MCRRSILAPPGTDAARPVRGLLRIALVLLLGLAAGSAVPAFAAPPIPALTGRVVDDAHVLSAGTIGFLTSKLQTFERQTTNQLVVVTVPDLKGYPIEDWGLALLRGWGIGQKDKNNGVVLLVAPVDRQLRIEVGYGLEGVLPDATAYKIIQGEIIPRFKSGDVDGGVTAGVDAIIGAIGGTYHPVEQTFAPSLNVPWFIQFLSTKGFIFVFILLAVVSSIRRRWDPTRNRYVWYLSSRSGRGSSGSGWSSGGGFSGGGGSGGGGGASGRW